MDMIYVFSQQHQQCAQPALSLARLSLENAFCATLNALKICKKSHVLGGEKKFCGGGKKMGAHMLISI